MTITIEITETDDAALACRHVAEAIEQGYTSGLIGCSADRWYIET